MTISDRAKAVSIVRKVIQETKGDWYRGRDEVGHRVWVHYGDDAKEGYAATVVYETYAWADYDVLDKIDDQLILADLPFELEPFSDYEVGLMGP